MVLEPSSPGDGHRNPPAAFYHGTRPHRGPLRMRHSANELPMHSTGVEDIRMHLGHHLFRTSAPHVKRVRNHTFALTENADLSSRIHRTPSTRPILPAHDPILTLERKRGNRTAAPARDKIWLFGHEHAGTRPWPPNSRTEFTNPDMEPFSACSQQCARHGQGSHAAVSRGQIMIERAPAAPVGPTCNTTQSRLHSLVSLALTGVPTVCVYAG